MRPEPTPERLLALRFPARADRLRDVREAVRICASRCDAGRTCADRLVIAVGEACQNVVRHAYAGAPGGPVELEIVRAGDALVCTLRDFAPKVDPATIGPRDLDDLRPGGLGTHLIRATTESAGFLNPGPREGNCFRMVVRLGRAEASMRHEVWDGAEGVVVRLHGDLDLEHAPRAREILLEAVDRERDVWIDFSGVNHLDSSGVSGLVEALQRAQHNGTGFALVSVGSAAMEVLELARLDEVFTIRDRLPEGLDAP